jgi:hypothetical protein
MALLLPSAEPNRHRRRRPISCSLKCAGVFMIPTQCGQTIYFLTRVKEVQSSSEECRMKAAGADQAGSEVVSQSVAAPAPLATLSKKSPGDRVPVSSCSGAGWAHDRFDGPVFVAGGARFCPRKHALPRYIVDLAERADHNISRSLEPPRSRHGRSPSC